MRRVCVLSFVVFAALGWLAPAMATSGRIEDPAGDVMQDMTNERTGGKLDIVSNEHSDDGLRVRYVLTMERSFEARDVGGIHWALYDLEGLKEWDCPSASVRVRVEGGSLVGDVVRCNGSGGGGSSGPGGQVILGPAEVTHRSGSRTVEVTYPIAALRQAGFTGTSIDYRVFTDDVSTAGDWAPDGDPTARHVLSPPPTPVPATPAPTPVPTVAPTPEPTVAPTPEPTIAATAITDGSPSVVSFATPGSDDDPSGEASVPLRIAAGMSVVTAAGAALLVLRPF